MAKKIAIVTPVFPPYCGGIGNVAYHQAVELKKLGHQVTVLTPDYGQPEITVDFELIKIKPLFKYGNAALVPKLPEFLAGFDIVHLHYPFFGGAEVVWWAKKKASCLPAVCLPAGQDEMGKLVLHYHMDVVGTGFLVAFFKIYRRFFLPKIIKCADSVIVTSIDYAQNSDIAEFLKNEPAKFVVVPNGVDIQKFSPVEKDLKLQTLHQLENSKVVLFVGGLDKAHYFKGVDYLIKAFAQVAVSAQLIIVGAGDLLPNYKKLVGELGLENRVIFAGKVSSADLPKYYNLADLVVLPSIDKSEAFGMVLLEAMACGKPVVASNLAGVRSVVDKSGFLVAPKNAGSLAEKISQILSDEKMATTMGAAGRQRVEQGYDWKIIGEKLQVVYDSIIEF